MDSCFQLELEELTGEIITVDGEYTNENIISNFPINPVTGISTLTSLVDTTTLSVG